MANDNNLLKNIKPCFSTSNAKILLNLHAAASEKAAQELHLKYDPSNINSFMINTGVTADGSNLSKVANQADTSDVGAFKSKDGKYEFGIVMQFTDYESPTQEELDKAKSYMAAVEKKNKSGLGKLKNTIFSAIAEYFKWFSGQEVKETDLVQFIPDYNDGAIAVKDGVIQGMDEKAMDEYFKNRTANNKQDDKDKKVGQNFAPRIGYKIGYVITTKASSKQAEVENPNV